MKREVKSLLNKALDSALLAVETYNKPAVKFKSAGYIVLMNIAWTSLLHAIFIKNGIKPIHKEKNKRTYKKIDGEYYYWELKTCAAEYFPENSPVRKNIEFFIPLRNKIEHKFLPAIDPNIFAECESLLLNFDKVVEIEFGKKYCMRESLSFALQLFPSSDNYGEAIIQNKDYESVIDFINQYRSSISTEILQSGQYAFKAFLIQVANHRSKDAFPVQFYSYDKMSDEDKKTVERIAALIKDKHIAVANVDKLKPADVVKKVQQLLGNKTIQKGKSLVDLFNMDTHTRCWKKYGVRPAANDPHPEHTDAHYCVYDALNKNYGYTQAWVDFLAEKLKDENEYNALYDVSLE